MLPTYQFEGTTYTLTQETVEFAKTDTTLLSLCSLAVEIIAYSITKDTEESRKVTNNNYTASQLVPLHQVMSVYFIQKLASEIATFKHVSTLSQMLRNAIISFPLLPLEKVGESLQVKVYDSQTDTLSNTDLTLESVILAGQTALTNETFITNLISQVQVQ